jgi:hypothetical protein
MKTPQQAATKYGTNGSAPTATQLWAANFGTAIPTMLTNAANAIPLWQAQVSSPAAATAMKKGLARAAQNQAAIATKATNVGAPALAAGVRVASTGAYLTFAQEWLPAVSNEVATLNQTNPRGTRVQNRARQAAYDAWVDSQAGNFKQ